MGKYISKQQLLNMLEHVPNSAMLSAANVNDKDTECAITAVEDATMPGFYKIMIDS